MQLWLLKQQQQRLEFAKQQQQLEDYPQQKQKLGIVLCQLRVTSITGSFR